ncbi:MAG: amino acid permease, partial [Acidimicrobiales bacterium]
PALIVLVSRIAHYYDDVGAELGLGSTPGIPQPEDRLIVVMVAAVSRMVESALATALSLGHEVVALSVQFDDERAAALQAEWDRWDPGIPLVVLRPHTRSIATPVLGYLGSAEVRDRKVMVLIPEVEPRKWRHRLLQNQRGAILADVLRRRSTAAVGRVPYHLSKD